MKLEHKITDVKRYNAYPQDVKEFYDGCAKAFISTIPDLNSDDFEESKFEELKTQINNSAETFAFEMSDAFKKAVDLRVETILKERNLYNFNDTLDNIRTKLQDLETKVSNITGGVADNTQTV